MILSFGALHPEAISLQSLFSLRLNQWCQSTKVPKYDDNEWRLVISPKWFGNVAMVGPEGFEPSTNGL